MGHQRRVCCICGYQKICKKASKKSLSTQWRSSKCYEKDFEACFGARAEGRSGEICNTCRITVSQKYKNDKDLCFSHMVDSKCKSKENENTSVKSVDKPVFCDITNSTSRNGAAKPAITIISLNQNATINIESDDTDDTNTPEDESVDTNHAANLPLQLYSPTHLPTHSPTRPPTDSPSRSPTCSPTHSPTSPCKRIRDESPPPRNVRSRQEVQNTATAFEEGPPISFFGHVLPRALVARILDKLPMKDCLNVVFNFILPELEQRNQKTKKEKEEMTERLEKEKEEIIEKLENFVDVDKYGPLTQPQKTMLGKLMVNRDNNTNEYDCVVIPHAGHGGRPKHYLKVPKIQVNSVQAAKRTKNVRSQFIEKVEKIISTPLTDKDAARDTGTTDGIHSQRVNNISRDLDGYATAGEEAGLKIITKFSRETVLSLRSVMTLRMWRVLKSVFHSEVGWDVFGSVDKLQKELHKIEFQYECGTFTPPTTGVPVHFVRVCDVKEVVKQMVEELWKADQLIYLDNLDKNCLWLHVALDKGGKTTKLILQVINQKNRHSIDNAKLIGYFEGKDDRTNLETIFGPILAQLQECVANIAELKLPRPPQLDQDQPSLVCTDHRKCDESICEKRFKPLHPFDYSNDTCSSTCRYCKQCVDKKSGHLQSIDQLDKPVQSDISSDKSLPRPAVLVVQGRNSSETANVTRQPDSPDQSDDSLSDQSNSRDECQPTSDQPESLPLTLSSDVPTCSTTREQFAIPSAVLPPSTSNSLDDSSPSLSMSSQSTPGPSLTAAFPSACTETPHRSTSTRCQPRKLIMESTLTSNEEPSEYFIVACLSCGGDWEGISKVCGLSGPNGKFFCNHCLVQLQHTKKGVPHAAHILPKYERYKEAECDFPLRTFERCKEKHAEYKANHKAKAMDFESCENAPLLDGGLIIDTISTTPLHISLGLGLQILNIIEAEAIKIDATIKKKCGQYDAFNTVYSHKKEVLLKCQSIKDEINEVEDKIDHVKERKKEIIRERGAMFKTDKKGRYVNKSDMAEGVRNHYKKLDSEKSDLMKDQAKLEKVLGKEEGKLGKVLKELDDIKGPFKTRLDDLLTHMRLQRAAYHSGALVGPDVKKLVTKKNIVKMGQVFKPMELELDSNGVSDEEPETQGESEEPETQGESELYYSVSDESGERINTFSSNRLRVKIITLLTKFRLCYELYTANRELCRHEVEVLALRCTSFGNWFPPNFPAESLKRKFHLLTVCVPRQARRLRTTGMLTEQTIESIHPYINELDRRFAKVSDKTRKGLIICKQQNMYSQPRWNSVKKLGKKK